MGKPNALKDHNALHEELTALVHQRDQRLTTGSRLEFVDAILDAVQGHLARRTAHPVVPPCGSASEDMPGSVCMLPANHPGVYHSNGTKAWVLLLRRAVIVPEPPVPTAPVFVIEESAAPPAVPGEPPCKCGLPNTPFVHTRAQCAPPLADPTGAKPATGKL